MKKVILNGLTIIAFLLIVTGCNVGMDLNEIIETDVKTNNNPRHFLTIETTTGGTVTPENEIEIVDEVPIEIIAVADSGYAFKEWEFSAGEEFAALGVSERTSENSILITGGDVAIEAIFVRQPVVISYYPEDEDVARNMPVRIVFSKTLDENSITSGTIQVFDNLQNMQIEGRLEVIGSEVMFFAEDSSLDMTDQDLYLWESNRHYQVYIRQNILDTDGIALLEEESWFFQTGTEEDNTPPVINSFTIESLDGNEDYTNNQSVLLSFDAEDESQIPIWAIKYWNGEDAEPATVTQLSEVLGDNGKIVHELSNTQGLKQVNLIVYDMSNNYSEDSVSITLDMTDPVLTAGLIDPETTSPYDDDGYANTRDLSFHLSATDVNDIVSFSMVRDDTGTGTTWQDYPPTDTDIILPDNDGEYSFSFAVKDSGGNVTESQESIRLDRAAPTGSIVIKGNAEWANASDQNAELTLTRSDLTLDFGDEIEIAFRVEGDGWELPITSGIDDPDGDGYFEPRTFAATITDVNLFTTDYLTIPDEEITVQVRLIDRCGQESIVSDSIQLDTDIPTTPGVPDLATEDDSGPTNLSGYNSDDLTNITDGLTLSGTCAFADTPLLEILDNGEVRGSLVPSADTYSFDGDGFGTGSRTVLIRASDPAGNIADSPALSIGIDNTAPTVSLQLYCNASGSYDRCQAPGAPSIRLTISKSDSGVAGLHDYRWDAYEEGGSVVWSSWTANASTSLNINSTYTDKWSTKYAVVEIRDAAGNESTTASDSILNYYRAKFTHTTLWVDNNSEDWPYNGEMFWEFDLYVGTVQNLDKIFYQPYTNYVSMDDDQTITSSNFITYTNNKYTATRYYSAPPSYFKIQGYLAEYDTSSGSDYSNTAIWTQTVTTGAFYNNRYYGLSISGAPSGSITFEVSDNY